MRKIALLGATSHIAKGLIYHFVKSGQHQLFLHARSVERANDFLSAIQCAQKVPIRSLEDFSNEQFDVIINCIGIGQPAQLSKAAGSILRLTETFDNAVLDYLQRYPDALSVNFSSGAVYGTDFQAPAEENSASLISVNHICLNDYYRIAKINSEAKHRAMKAFNIVDLRIFAYFSRFIDLDSHYLMADLISAVKTRIPFVTGPDDIMRDYVHPLDLFRLVTICVEKRSLNDAFDVYSKHPVSKFQLLDYFHEKYGLTYRVKEGAQISSVTGGKSRYFSNFRKAREIGYDPEFSSLEGIAAESKEILDSRE